jgi:uncharacterized protein YtpQ (UPF0354 family)
VWDFKTLEERELPPMSAEMFSTLVISRLRPIQGIEIASGKGLQLQVRVREQETTAHLERAYDRYLANPDMLTAAIDELIQDIVSGNQNQPIGNQEFERITSRLLPRLVTAQQWVQKRDTGLRLVIRPIVQDLGEALVLDSENEFEYVQIDAIPAWGLDAQAAYGAAFDNLARRTSGAQFSVSGEGTERLLMDHEPDGYAAARALLPSRLADWQARISGELVLAMPTHDLLLGFSREHPALNELRDQIAHDANKHSDGLFAKLLLVRNASLNVLE